MIAPHHPKLCVSYLGLVDGQRFPAIVEYGFMDVLGRSHVFRDKLPIFSEADAGIDNEMPQTAVVCCQIIENRGSSLIIDTSKPYGILSTDDKFVFEVNASDITLPAHAR